MQKTDGDGSDEQVRRMERKRMMMRRRKKRSTSRRGRIREMNLT